MANHVNTNVEFRNLNEAGKAKLAELISRVRPTEEGRHYQWFGDMWVDGKEGSPSYEETDQYAWTTENIGPKWCYFEDIGDDYFNTTSAWSYPEDGLVWMFEQISAVNPEVVAVVTYEDEMPNFFGLMIWAESSYYDSAEWDSDEIQNLMEERVPEIAEMKDEDEDLTEEGWDLWNENIWELASDTQFEYINDTLENLE